MYEEVKNLPKYVIVYCKHFGNSLSGWRLNEVIYYCFADNYIKAKQIVDNWNRFSGYNSGLSFMIKYENQLFKGGRDYDGRPLEIKRYL